MYLWPITTDTSTMHTYVQFLVCRAPLPPDLFRRCSWLVVFFLDSMNLNSRLKRRKRLNTCPGGRNKRLQTPLPLSLRKPFYLTFCDSRISLDVIRYAFVLYRDWTWWKMWKVIWNPNPIPCHYLSPSIRVAVGEENKGSRIFNYREGTKTLVAQVNLFLTIPTTPTKFKLSIDLEIQLISNINNIGSKIYPKKILLSWATHQANWKREMIIYHLHSMIYQAMDIYRNVRHPRHGIDMACR